MGAAGAGAGGVRVVAEDGVRLLGVASDGLRELDRGGVMPANSPPSAGSGLVASTPALAPVLPLKRIKVPAIRGTDDETIRASCGRRSPETWTRSGPGWPRTRTGILVTYSFRIT